MPSSSHGRRRSLMMVVLASAALAAAGAAQPPAERPQTSPDPSRAQPEPGRRGPGQPGGPGSEPRNVEGAMKLINRGLRTLSRQIDDTSKKAENLKLVWDAERGA